LISVQGGPASLSIGFQSAPTLLGLPESEGNAIVLGSGGIILVGALLALYLRRPRRPAVAEKRASRANPEGARRPDSP